MNHFFFRTIGEAELAVVNAVEEKRPLPVV
jgi:hypothetical protein